MKDNEKNRNDIPGEELSKRIDFKKFAPEKPKKKKTNVFKSLFKKNKAFELSSDSDERATVDPEAKKISERYGLAYSILWIVLIVFVVSYFAFFSDSITTGSMQYVFRDMLGHGGGGQTVSGYGFSVNDNAVFTEFSGVPVIAGQDRVVIFAPDGSHQYSDESPYDTPSVESSEKYLLIYDENGNTVGERYVAYEKINEQRQRRVIFLYNRHPKCLYLYLCILTHQNNQVHHPKNDLFYILV